MYKRTRRSSYLVLSQLIVAVFLMTGAAQAANVGAHFVHYATVDNAYGGSTQFHHPLTDDRPDAIVHVTQNWNPPGSSGTDNDKVIGVIYYNGQWSIFNEDDSPIPVGAAFNIWVPPVDASTFLHTATVGNLDGHISYIDNPLTNNNPYARLRMTPNWNPGGGGGYYNNSVAGVFYSSSSSKWAVFNQDLVDIPVSASFNITVLPNDPTVFVHRAIPANTNLMWTTIDNPLTNNKPNAIVSVTQNWNPDGTLLGTLNPHPVGVYYIGSKWTIFNRDHANMPINAAFNVSVPSSESALFVHSADPGNSYNQMTFIDHPLSNSNPNAIVSVTQSWNPGGAGGTDNDHALGVLYNYSRSAWAVFNQDLAAMPEGASFNASIPAVDASIFVHMVSPESVGYSWTYIDNPVTNGNPDAIVHVTQNWDASGIGGVYNDHNTGVRYSSSAEKWAIFNQDLAAMPEGACFNVSIPAVDTETFVHTADSANTSGNYTVFHHPLTDGNPDAIVTVTQNWNPPGGSGVYNDHSISVWYTGGHNWSIFNQDGAAILEGASFNITVAAPIIFSDGFESGNTSAWSAAVP